jgi:hypothetical protein
MMIKKDFADECYPLKIYHSPAINDAYGRNLFYYLNRLPVWDCLNLNFYSATDERAMPDCVMQARDEHKYMFFCAYLCSSVAKKENYFQTESLPPVSV